MEKQKARERIEKLKETINYHRYLIHVLDKQEISDEALDSLKRELFLLEQKYPEFITLDSPTQRVEGRVLSGFKKIRHKQKMLSLNDVFNNEEFENWTEKLKKNTTQKTNEFFAETKFDGLAVSLIYKKGKLFKASTRGDGIVGEDVTVNIKTIESIPLALNIFRGLPQNLKINLKKILENGEIEIRGEVIILKNDFEKINKEQEKKGLSKYANPRNLAAGSIRQLDPAITASRNLHFFAWDIVGNFGQKFHSEEHITLQALGFKSDKFARRCNTKEDVFKFKNFIEEKRNSLNYEIDGIVVSLNNNEIYENLGVVGKSPKGAIAFKFGLKEAATKLENIIVQVGRTGNLTPVAILEPIELSGITISRATLHNFDNIERLGLKIGDTVIVGRAGDVIPRIVNVLKNLRTGKEKNFKIPLECPVCQEKTIKDKGGVYLKCLNKNCPAKKKKNLYYFVSKKGFDISGLGPKIINTLFQNALIQDASDLFDLKEGDLLLIERFAEKSSRNLIKAIQKKKKISFPKFIVSLGIFHVGEETALDLAKKFGNIKNLETASLEDLENIQNIGSIVAKSVYNWFRDKYNLKFLEKLERTGMEIEKIKEQNKPAMFTIHGKIFVLTGTLEKMSRDEAKEKIRETGGEISETVSKKTNYVIVGNEPGNKFEIAKSLEIKILNEKEFLKMINF